MNSLNRRNRIHWKRLLPILIEQGHDVICCVRDKNRFYTPERIRKSITVIEVDFLKEETLKNIPTEIDVGTTSFIPWQVQRIIMN
jgi:hypothetical protein